MKHEKGAALPGVLIFSFIFLSMLVHELEMVRTERRFYFEAEQSMLLDQVMMNAVQQAKRKLEQTSSVPAAHRYTGDGGTADISYTSIGSSQLRVSISCRTQRGRAYQASFLYNKKDMKIRSWTEGR